MTVLPVLLAIREFREKYQVLRKLSGAAEERGALKEVSLGGAEDGRGGGAVGLGFDLDCDLRLREGGESKVVFIGVAGGVSWGVVGVAGSTMIARLGETSKGVDRFALELLLEELAASSPGMMGERRQGGQWATADFVMSEPSNSRQTLLCL